MEATPITQNEPRTGEVLLNLWQARLYILGGLIIAALGCIIFFATAIPHYKTEMIVAPTTRSYSSDKGDLALDPVVLNSASYDSPDFMHFEAIMTEPRVAARLMEDDYILRSITQARRFGFLIPDKPENAAALSAWLGKHVQLENIPEARLKRIVVWHEDKEFGPYLLHKLYQETDSLIRSAVVIAAEDRVLWLKGKLDSTKNVQRRRALTDLLIDQEQTSMILTVDEPYAAVIAEPASVSAKPVWPRRGVIMPVFALIGMFLGYMLFSLCRALQN